jgi:phospholipid/cholesterol/gamma-HCH transport system permease protein
MTRSASRALQLTLAGTWRVGEAIPRATLVRTQIDAERPERILFDTHAVAAWNSALVSFSAQVLAIARSARVAVDHHGLPLGVQRLLALAEATPVELATTPKPRPPILARIGTRAVAFRVTAKEVLVAIGELTVAFTRLARGRARLRGGDLVAELQACGVRALGIVTLVNGLVGLIIAFIAAAELAEYGATIYVANLVGIAVVRELAAVMTAIVVAGRTGAAFAAELGTMRVTQEVDALVTLGVSPVEFLVLPRVLAVTLMMPLLCVYADVVGVAGGAAVSISVMHIAPRLYLAQTLHAVSLGDFWGGLYKATTYGFLVAEAGCFMGLRAGRSAAAVGKAATGAVVAGIVLVIVACGLYAMAFYRLGF